MQNRTFRSLAMVLATAALVSGCASNAAFKNHYAATDFQMGYLEPGNNAADQLMARIQREVASVDTAIDSVDKLTQKLPGPAGEQVKTAIGSIKHVLDDTIKGQIVVAMRDHQVAFSQYLAGHNVFASKDHPYGYNLVDPLKGNDAETREANALIAEVNGTLKDAYKVTTAVDVSKRLVGLLQNDVKTLKTSPSVEKLAGIGLISMSVTRNTLNSVDEAQTLLPRVQALLAKTKSELAAKPALAFKLGGLPGQLGSAVSGLASVPKDAPELLSNLSSLTRELASN